MKVRRAWKQSKCWWCRYFMAIILCNKRFIMILWNRNLSQGFEFCLNITEILLLCLLGWISLNVWSCEASRLKRWSICIVWHFRAGGETTCQEAKDCILNSDLSYFRIHLQPFCSSFTSKAAFFSSRSCWCQFKF